jgi:hypothetical protein
MMGIFLLLASQFRSYIQPVIIMMAIPFGLIGAIFGHLIMGIEFTIVSIFGIVALSGIVVNDSLILIDFINRALRNGVDIHKAVIESGKARFRPVLLTSVTTIAGLFPLLLERSFQAQFLIPMAVSICFGLLVATILTLLYVPALYLIVADVTNLFVGREQRLLNAASGPEGLQGPTPRREGGMGNAELKGSGARVTAAGSRQEPAVGRQKRLNAEGSRRKTEVGGQKTEGRRQRILNAEGGLRQAQTSRMGNAEFRGKGDQVAAVGGKQIAGDKSRKIEVREQRAETISQKRSRPSTALKQTTRKAEIKEQKKKVTS